MTIITKDGWTLHYTIGDVVAAAVKLDDVITDVHNNEPNETWAVTGATPPHRVGTTGKVYIKSSLGYTGGYYPSVIGARWIHEGGGHAR